MTDPAAVDPDTGAVPPSETPAAGTTGAPEAPPG